VDDEPALRNLIVELLSDYNYQPLEARNGEHALELIRDHGNAIDLLLTDIKMPGLDGPALSLLAKKIVPSIKVLFISGYSENASSQYALADDRAGYLQKPFTPEALYSAIETLLDDPTRPNSQN
jgi:CheY-like chemotaxis protein